MAVKIPTIMGGNLTFTIPLQIVPQISNVSVKIVRRLLFGSIVSPHLNKMQTRVHVVRKA